MGEEKDERRLQRREGAKDARHVIGRFHALLNSADLVPEQCYKPNSLTFRLVLTINQITGLILSKNYDPILFFLIEANKALRSTKPDLVTEPYRKVAQAYLAQVAYYLNTLEYLDAEALHLKARLPQELILLGPQLPPGDEALGSGA